MKYDAIIFDLFGTLVDNYREGIFKQRLAEMANVLNVPQQDFIQEFGDGGSRELSGANAVGMDAIMIRVPREEIHDVHRLEADAWQGSCVTTLKSILPFVDDRFTREKLER